MSAHTIVFKDKKSREIKTYVNLEGHGASMEITQFISLVAELYGSPASTMRKKTFLDRLNLATHQAIMEMKSQTREIAALSIEPAPKE